MKASLSNNTYAVPIFKKEPKGIWRVADKKVMGECMKRLEMGRAEEMKRGRIACGECPINRRE